MAEIRSKSLLELVDACFRINGSLLLNNVNLKLLEGEVTCIVGPNGAGKSTLLRAIASDLSLTSGEIFFSGKHLNQWDIQGRARQLAVLPQSSSLSFPFSVGEVVGLGRIPHSSGIEIDKSIVQQAMKAFDVLHLEGRLYTELSGGERQRVQLARVFSQIWLPQGVGGRLLILDEPVHSLDLKHQLQLMTTIRGFSCSDVAVLVVLHDLQLASQYADNIIAMKCGAIHAQGSVLDVLNKEVVREVFDVDPIVVSHPVSNKPMVLL